jgi:hypothetical protein
LFVAGFHLILLLFCCRVSSDFVVSLLQGFMVQTGDPTNTGKGGESIWGKTFSDEIKVKL